MMAVIMVVMMLMIVVMVMTVFVIVVVDVLGDLLPAVHRDAHVDAGDAQLDGLFALEGDAGKAQAVHLAQEGGFVGQKVVQGRHEHVASRAHAAFEIQGLHWHFSFAQSHFLRLNQMRQTTTMAMETSMTTG